MKTTAATKDLFDERGKLEEEIKKLESAAGGTVEKPELPSVKLDYITYDPPTDDQLKQNASDSLQSYKDGQISAIKNNSAAEAEMLAGKKDEYSAKFDAEKSQLEELYDAAARRIDNDVIKRGLARSTVATSSKGDLESEYLKKSADLNRDYGKQLADIDAQISQIDGKLKAALDDFNISYAVKLNEKLAELREERNKKTYEAVKYNNEIKAKQAQLDASKAKTESDLYSAALDRIKKENSLDGLSQSDRNDLYRSVYAQMDAYLSSLDETTARLEIRNHDLFRTHLSDYYYYKLYDKYGR